MQIKNYNSIKASISKDYCMAHTFMVATITMIGCKINFFMDMYIKMWV